MSYAFLEVNNILASNIVNEKNSLFWSDAGCRQCLKECKVNIFLLLVKIGFGVLRGRPEVRGCGGEGSYGVTGVRS